MQTPEFIEAVLKLELEEKDYIVIGSGVLGVLGIREVDDVDLVVSAQVFKEYDSRGWEKKDFGDGTYALMDGDYEMLLDFDSTDLAPNLEDLKKDQLVIEGVPFMSLQRLAGWKQKRGRDKDIRDVKLIQKYLADQEGAQQ